MSGLHGEPLDISPIGTQVRCLLLAVGVIHWEEAERKRALDCVCVAVCVDQLHTTTKAVAFIPGERLLSLGVCTVCLGVHTAWVGQPQAWHKVGDPCLLSE